MNAKKHNLEKIYSLINLWKSFFEENDILISKNYLLKEEQENKVKSIYSKIIDLYEEIKKEKKANLFFFLLFKNKYVSDKLSDAENIFFTDGSFNPRKVGKFVDFTRKFLYAFTIKHVNYQRKKDSDYDKKFLNILDMMKKYPDLTIDEIMEML